MHIDKANTTKCEQLLNLGDNWYKSDNYYSFNFSVCLNFFT